MWPCKRCLVMCVAVPSSCSLRWTAILFFLMLKDRNRSSSSSWRLLCGWSDLCPEMYHSNKDSFLDVTVNPQRQSWQTSRDTYDSETPPQNPRANKNDMARCVDELPLNDRNRNLIYKTQKSIFLLSRPSPRIFVPLFRFHTTSAATRYRIGRPYPGGGMPSPQSRCWRMIELSRPTSSCRLCTVCCNRSFSIVTCSTLPWSSFNHAFFLCRHFSAAKNANVSSILILLQTLTKNL